MQQSGEQANTPSVTGRQEIQSLNEELSRALDVYERVIINMERNQPPHLRLIPTIIDDPAQLGTQGPTQLQTPPTVEALARRATLLRRAVRQLASGGHIVGHLESVSAFATPDNGFVPPQRFHAMYGIEDRVARAILPTATQEIVDVFNTRANVLAMRDWRDDNMLLGGPKFVAKRVIVGMCDCIIAAYLEAEPGERRDLFCPWGPLYDKFIRMMVLFDRWDEADAHEENLASVVSTTRPRPVWRGRFRTPGGQEEEP